MNDLIRIVIVGFLSGVAGAAVVLSINSEDGESQQVAEPAAGEAVPGNAAATDEPATSFAIPERPAPTAVDAPEASAVDEAATASEASPEDRRAESRRRREERIAEQLRAAGWSETEIESLDDVRNAAALEMEKMIYERMREASEEDRNALRMFRAPDTFRDSLGDEKYEQYLEASGQSTAVTVRSLLRGSAAESAGIQQGDRIRRYGDVRVYDEGDLLDALIEGDPGESVTVEIERDGTVFHVTLPRGPIGTSGFGRRWR